MLRRTAPVCLFAFVLHAFGLASLARPVMAQTVPGAAATAAPACASVQPPTPIAAFAHPIDDRPTLRLIAAADGVARAQHEATLHAIATPLGADAAKAIAAALPTGCVDAEITSRAARLLYETVGAWPTMSDDDRDAMYASALWAMSALTVRDKLSEFTVDEALEPFGTNLAQLTAPTPSPSPASSPCESTAAAVLRKSPPEYPGIAAGYRASGRVTVKIVLDDEGDVRAATVYEKTVPENDGGNALTQSALFAAASSSYAPATSACAPIAGAYLFIISFATGR